MENIVCDLENTTDSENTSLNEATPAVAAVLTSEVPQDVGNASIETVECDDAISSTTPDKFTEDGEVSTNIESVEESCLKNETDTDYFTSELCISDVPNEKITENVEDIVQDLENLLGEPLENSKLSESCNEVNSSNTEDIQGSNLCEIEQTNSSSSVDCNIAQNLSEVINDSEENQFVVDDIGESDLIEVARAAEETNAEGISEELNVINDDVSVSQINSEDVFMPTIPETENTRIDDVVQYEIQTPEQNAPIIFDTQLELKETNEGEAVQPTNDNLETLQAIAAIEEEARESLIQLTEDVVNVDNIIESTVLSDYIEPEVVSSVFSTVEQDKINIQSVESVSEVLNDLLENSSSANINEVCSESFSSSEIIEHSITECVNEEGENKDIEANTELLSVTTEKDLTEVSNKQVEEEVEATSETVENIEQEIMQNVLDMSIAVEQREALENIEQNDIQETVQDIVENIEQHFTENSDVIQDMEMSQSIIENIEGIIESSEAIEDIEMLENVVENIKESTMESTSPKLPEAEESSVVTLNVGMSKNVETAEYCEIIENAVQSIEQEMVGTSFTQSEELHQNLEKESIDEVLEKETNIETIEDVKNVESEISQEGLKEDLEALQDMVENSEPKTVQLDQDILEETFSTEIQTENEQFKEQNLSTVTKELGQPLTVQVEDSIFDEEQASDKQATEEPVITEKLQTPEILDDKKSGENEQGNRESLKMTITRQKSDNVHSILKIYNPNEAIDTRTTNDQDQNIPKLIIKTVSPTISKIDEQLEETAIPKITIKAVPTSTSETESSPKLTIKSIKPEAEGQIENLKPATGSPKITIKPIVKPESLSPLKLTIKPYPKLEELQSTSKFSIKPVIKPGEEIPTESHHSPKITIKPIIKPLEASEERSSPKITIKPLIKPQEDVSRGEESQIYSEEKHSPKITIKPIIKPAEEEEHSPRITIKPIVKPPEECVKDEEKHSPRITIKPVVKPPEESFRHESSSCSDERYSPRITIKPVIKPFDDSSSEEVVSSEEKNPKITIKPVVKPFEESSVKDAQNYMEESHSPRITIKPILKPPEAETENVHSPRITIKPIVKPQADNKGEESTVSSSQPFKLNIKPVVKPPECSLSPKITIKPVTKPAEPEHESIELIDFEEQIKQERIVLKIAKNNKRTCTTSLETEKLKKIKLKLSKEHHGLAHIVQTTPEILKRTLSNDGQQELQYLKTDLPPDLSRLSTSDVTITRVDNTNSNPVSEIITHNELSHTITPIPLVPPDLKKELISSSFNAEDIPDPLAEIPVFEITLESASASKTSVTPVFPPTGIPPAPTPRKRGRPRKVPLEVREEFKDPKEEEIPQPPVEESSRPKRSCRGTSIAATLGIKPRKPRAPSTRGRGRGRGSRGGSVGRPAKVCGSK